MGSCPPLELTVENTTVENGQAKEYYAVETLTVGPNSVGPNFAVNNGGQAALRSSGTIVLAPGFNAENGSPVTIDIVAEPPTQSSRIRFI